MNINKSQNRQFMANSMMARENAEIKTQTRKEIYQQIQ